ncbi:threonine/serine dehydratase [Streptomyces sp. NPDC050095]|uniref:threonine/serine dehydratase n=1 Tax=unclassified Streptomyces TaxID=2593676 RepID=UPI00343553E8
MNPYAVMAAVQSLRGIAVRTPMLTSSVFDALVARRVWVKAENQQRTGSFKLRGAYNAVASLGDQDRGRGVIGASSGNHAQALALAARLHEVPATVVIPADVPKVKRQAIVALGADIVTYNRRMGRRDAVVSELAHRRRLAVVPSASDPAVVAGAGTVAWEMLQEVPDLVAIFVPVGGGGLAAGSALAALGHNPSVKVIGVEPAVADDTFRSLREGRQISIPPPTTVADGLTHTEPPRLTFDINRRLLGNIVTVSEQEITDAMAHLWRYYRSAAEPSGAVALAGLLQMADRLPEGPIGVVLSGGNVDWGTYRGLLDIAMTRTETEPHDATVLH